MLKARIGVELRLELLLRPLSALQHHLRHVELFDAAGDGVGGVFEDFGANHAATRMGFLDQT